MSIIDENDPDNDVRRFGPHDESVTRDLLVMPMDGELAFEVLGDKPLAVYGYSEVKQLAEYLTWWLRQHPEHDHEAERRQVAERVTVLSYFGEDGPSLHTFVDGEPTDLPADEIDPGKGYSTEEWAEIAEAGQEWAREHGGEKVAAASAELYGIDNPHVRG